MPVNETTKYTVDEQNFYTKLIIAMGGAATKEISAFSGWMIAGAAAFYAVLINSADKLSPYLSICELGGSLRLFLAAVVLNVVQRLIGAVVAASVAASHEVTQLKPPDTVNFKQLTGVLETSTWFPLRWYVRSRFQSMINGKTQTFYTPANLAQAQFWLVVLQLFLISYSGWRLIP